MSLSFVKVQFCTKGVEHIRLAILRICLHQISDHAKSQFDRNRSPTIIQTQSQFLNKQAGGLEASIQLNEMNFDTEPRKNKQLTFLQSKVRASTTPMNDNILRQQLEDEEIDEEQNSELISMPEQIKIKKKLSRVSQHTFETKELKVENHRQSDYLKFGDVFVIKADIGNSLQGVDNNHELICIGNSNYQGSINCVNMSNQLINNPYALQQKCFFSLINPRTVSNDFRNVFYGQRILLQHVKSGQCLQMNLETPAEERGSFEVKLVNQQDHQSILRIMPISNSKRVGDKIQYNEQITFQQDASRSYYLKLEKEESRYGSNKFIDINAGDQADCFHFHKVTNHSNNIIKIIHQESQNQITSTDRQLPQFIFNKTCIINNQDNQDQQQQSQETFSLRQFDYQKYLVQEFEVLVSSNSNSYSLFEIQPIFPFTEQQSSPHACRLKSLFTQQYLSLDPNDDKRLKLTPSIQSQHSLFYLMPEQDEGDIVSIQSNIGSFLTLQTNGKLLFVNLNEDQTPQQFNLQKIDSKNSLFLEEVNEIQNRILNFHIYLQSWSIISDKRKQNDEILSFDYMKALQEKSQLEQEVLHLETQLQSLSKTLEPKPYSLESLEESSSEYSIGEKQSILREQKIIEMIFMVLRLVDNIIYTQQKAPREKDKSRLFKLPRQLPPQHTSSYVAFKVLNPLPLLMYKILLLCAKGSTPNRRLVLDNDEFLSQQIRSYGQQVASLLKECIVDAHNVDMGEWVRLLDPLDEIGSNIYDMTIYLKIISISMVDQNGHGITRHQNKVCKELFSQGKNGKTKFLCQFNILADKATFNLYREEPLADFLIHNPSLNAMHVIRSSEINEELFSIEELAEKTIIKKSIIPFLSYLTASINLMAQMCSGRNKKCMKKIQFCGITSQHILSILRSNSIPLSMKNSYIKLYQVLYVDIDPFMPLDEQINFIWSQLNQQKDLKMAQIFNHYIEPVEVGKLTKEFEEKMFPILLELLSTGNIFQEGLIKVKKTKKITFKLNSIRASQAVKATPEFKSKSSQKMKFLTSLYFLIFKAISLGYLTQEQICKIIKPMLQIFIPFLTVQERAHLEAQENWLSDLMQGALKSIQEYGLVDLVDQLYSVMGQVLIQYFKLQLNIQTFEFVLYFQNSYKSYCLQNLSKLMQECKGILDQMQLDSCKNYVQKSLLSFYCSNWPKQFQGFKVCTQALMYGSQQKWIQQLRNAEIIYEDELELYMQLTGNSLVGQIFSPIRLEIQIHQLEEEFTKKKDEGKQKEEKTQEIDNQLNKLINRINEMKYDQFKLRKTQNILRNLKVHKQILKLLRLKELEKMNGSQTQQIAIKFLSLFALQNPINAEEIQESIPDILKLQQLKISKLIGVLSNSLDKQNIQNFKSLNHSIFQTMTEYRPKCLQMYDALLSLHQCKRLVAISDKTFLLKREILSNLFKSPHYINDILYYRQYLEIKSKKEEQQFYQNDFKIYSAVTSLTSYIISDYPIGIVQIQSILVNEQINQILFNPATSFIFKAELLKIIYSTQIQNVPTFTMQDMRELLILLLNDFLAFPKYLEGIFKHHEFTNEEQQQIINADLQQMTQIKLQIFSDIEEKKKNLLATTPGPNNQQNAAQQQAAQLNEAKKIVQDNNEYWRFLFSISRWKRVQFGMLKLFLQLFQEIINRKWNIQESQVSQQVVLNEQMTQNTDDSLFDSLALIKLNLDNLRNLLKLIIPAIQFSKNRIYVAELQYCISECLMNCPLTQNLKNFKSNKYTIEDKTVKAIKQQIRQKVNFSQEDLKNNVNEFYEKLRLFMLRKHLTLYRMMDMMRGSMQFNQDMLTQEDLFSIEGPEKIHSKDQFCKLFQQMYDEHYEHLTFCQTSGNADQTCITYDDAAKYYDSYLQIKDSQKNYLDINKFYNKFINYLNSMKIGQINIQQKTQQQEVCQLLNIQQSQFIKDSFVKFVYQYDLLINPLNPYNFYKLENESFELLAQQFAIRLVNSENCGQIFNKILKEEASIENGLSLNLLYELILFCPQIVEQQSKVHQFIFQQIPTLLIYLDQDASEYQQTDFKKLKMILHILLNLQEIDSIKFAQTFISVNGENYSKFISRIFNQTDRLLSLDQNSRQQKLEYQENQWFYSKSEMQKERNKLLEQLLKMIQWILKCVGQLFLNYEVQEYFKANQKTQIILEEILYFTTNYFSYINRSQLTHISTECDILIIYTHCIISLNSFCESNSENQSIIMNHKQLIPMIQYIITTSKYDLLADNLQDNLYRKLFKVTLQLLTQVKLEVNQIYSELQYQILFERLIKIYDSQQGRRNTILKGITCTHKADLNCTYLHCFYGCIPPGEQELFNICFDILILFNILTEHCDLIGNENQTNKVDYWQSIKGYQAKEFQDFSQNQKRNINFIKIYQSIRAFVNQQPFDRKRKSTLSDYLLTNEQIIQSIEITDHKPLQRINYKKPSFINKAPPIIKINNKMEQISPKMKFKESIYKITNKKQLVHQSLDEAIPFKKLEDNEQEDSALRLPNKLNARVNTAVINWYEDTQNTQVKDQRKKELCMKMAEAIHFFTKYIGQIDINLTNSHESSQLLYFILPFQSTFLHKKTKQKLKELKTQNNKYSQLIAMAQYFQEEVKYNQTLSKYKFITQFFYKIERLKIFNYILVLTINILYLGSLKMVDDILVVVPNPIYYIILVINIILTLTSLFVLIVEIINAQAFLCFKVNYHKQQMTHTYNLGFEFNEAKTIRRIANRRKLRFQQYLNQSMVFAQIFNPIFIYYMFYFILSLLSIFIYPIISLLLFDIIHRSKNLKAILQSISQNIVSLLQIIFLTFIIIYCYAFLAFATIEQKYLRANYTDMFFDVFIAFVNYGIKLDSVLEDENSEGSVKWGQYAFMITIFIIVFLIFFALIIGIVAGTYGNMKEREKNNEYQKCQICGITQQQCIQRNVKWNEHIRKKHKLATYLLFIMSIQNKNTSECTFVEREIKQRLDKTEMNWLPQF